MTTGERLYGLLPAVLRRRDADQGEPLRALASVLESQLAAIEADVETTYDNWFIETCEEWLVPYIGETLGVRGMRTVEATDFSLRAHVANTLQRRRRKGTAAATEQLARDVTGYPARAVDLFALTAITTHVNHVRETALPARLGTIDVRDPTPLEAFAGPFDGFAHLPDVRPIGGGTVRHNFPNLALFLWRVASWEVSRSTARPFPGESRWYSVDPLGLAVPLFNLPVGEEDIAALAGPEHVPHPVTRLELAGYGAGADPPVVVRTVAAGVERTLAIEVCNLADVGGVLPGSQPVPGTVAVDPELGRLAFHPDDVAPSAAQPFEVLVDHSYGRAGRLGAGPFDRSASWAGQLADEIVDRQWAVSRTDTAVGTEAVVATLEEAVTAWNGWVAAVPVAERQGAVGLITLTDSRSYDAPATPVELPDGARLYVVAARWTVRSVDGVPERRTGDVVANQTRPHVRGDVVVVGWAAAGATRGGGLWLNGLLLEGTVRVEPGDLDHLDLAHCTLASATSAGGIEVHATAGDANSGLAIRLDRCVTGPVRAARPVETVDISDSLVQAATGLAIDLGGGTVDLDATTVVGGVRCTVLSATDAILDEGDMAPAAALDVAQCQQGCLRFSYVPSGATTPRRYRCQPDLALEGVAPEDQAAVIALVRPRYAAEALGDPGLGLLAADGPAELRTASSDGSEPGVWHHLEHGLRLANLRAGLRQYLRFGLEAGALLDR